MTVSLCKHAFPLLLGPTVFTACLLLPAPVGLGPAAWLTLGVAMWMAIWWSTEAIPLPVTALLPVGFALNLFATGLVSGLAYLLVNAVFL